MRNGLIRTPFSTWARRGVVVVIVSIGLVIAWSYAGLATLITDYTIGNDGVVRSDAHPTPPPTPVPKPQPTATGYGNTSAMQAAPPKAPTSTESPYTVTRVKNVFTVSRNGTPWVVLTQGSGSIIVGDPSRTSRGVVDITLAKPGSKYKETR